MALPITISRRHVELFCGFVKIGGEPAHVTSLRTGKYMAQSTPVSVEEHVHGDTVWVAVRSRGADWSWLTPQEAVQLGRELIEKYAPPPVAAE